MVQLLPVELPLACEPAGHQGIGELPMVGAAAANSVFHATGKRVRDYPMPPDKLLHT